MFWIYVLRGLVLLRKYAHKSYTHIPRSDQRRNWEQTFCIILYVRPSIYLFGSICKNSSLWTTMLFNVVLVMFISGLLAASMVIPPTTILRLVSDLALSVGICTCTFSSPRGVFVITLSKACDFQFECSYHIQKNHQSTYAIRSQILKSSMHWFLCRCMPTNMAILNFHKSPDKL
jgi:hypothetical protein